jgi:hypothetical protein
MNKAPSLLTVESVVETSQTCHKKIDDQWVPARPMGLYSLINRFKLAWGVFTGEYDALRWHGQ